MSGLDRIEHAITGALVSLGAYGLYKHLKQETPTITGALGSIILGGFAGVLPDLIEPATNPNHRGFFHSIALLAMLAQGNQKMWETQNLTENQKLAISLFSAAFGSHLISDSSSARGIPLII